MAASKVKTVIVLDDDWMTFPNDARVDLSRKIYAPSCYYGHLPSEAHRKIHPEVFLVRANGSVVPTLAFFSIKALAENFEKGCIDHVKFSKDEWDVFGRFLSIYLPLIDVLEVKTEVYWKKVYLAFCKDKCLAYQKLCDKSVSWRRIAIERKFAHTLQTTLYKKWIDDDMNILALAVAPFITDLSIVGLQPQQTLEDDDDKNEDLRHIRIMRYPPDECNHGNLDLLRHLYDLQTLHIEAGPIELPTNYDNKLFSFSEDDIANISLGLQLLGKLRKFIFRRTRLSPWKLSHILAGLSGVPLQTLELSECKINNNGAGALAEFLLERNTLKSLELCGNYLSEEGISALSYGIRYFKGQLDYLGLARNPITDGGILALGGGLKDTKQVKHLNLNGVKITTEGCKILAELITMHHTFQYIEMSALPFGKDGGDALIKLLQNAHHIIKLECRGCTLSEDQTLQISLLIERNVFLHENRIKPNITAVSAAKSMKWMTREKNPALILVHKANKKRRICLERQKKEMLVEETIAQTSKHDDHLLNTCEILRCAHHNFSYMNIASSSDSDSSDSNSSRISYEDGFSQGPHASEKKIALAKYKILKHITMDHSTYKTYFKPPQQKSKLTLLKFMLNRKSGKSILKKESNKILP